MDHFLTNRNQPHLSFFHPYILSKIVLLLPLYLLYPYL
jgi:hypothetical protein